jgi:hypothetical protein
MIHNSCIFAKDFDPVRVSHGTRFGVTRRRAHWHTFPSKLEANPSSPNETAR